MIGRSSLIPQECVEHLYLPNKNITFCDFKIYTGGWQKKCYTPKKLFFQLFDMISTRTRVLTARIEFPIEFHVFLCPVQCRQTPYVTFFIKKHDSEAVALTTKKAWFWSVFFRKAGVSLWYGLPMSSRDTTLIIGYGVSMHENRSVRPFCNRELVHFCFVLRFFLLFWLFT